MEDRKAAQHGGGIGVWVQEMPHLGNVGNFLVDSDAEQGVS